jgi:hypothetical protein
MMKRFSRAALCALFVVVAYGGYPERTAHADWNSVDDGLIRGAFVRGGTIRVVDLNGDVWVAEVGVGFYRPDDTGMDLPVPVEDVKLLDGGGSVLVTKGDSVWVQPGLSGWAFVGVFDVVGVPADSHRGATAVLGQSTPNPFGTSTTIAVKAETAARDARIEIFDAQGRRVRRIAIGQVEPTELSVTWDGRDDAGVVLSTGVYFYQLAHAEGVSGTLKAIRLK